jgi:hypothetical protein
MRDTERGRKRWDGSHWDISVVGMSTYTWKSGLWTRKRIERSVFGSSAHRLFEGNCKKKYKGVRKENNCSMGEWRFAYGNFVSASANLFLYLLYILLTELTARSAFSYSFECLYVALASWPTYEIRFCWKVYRRRTPLEPSSSHCPGHVSHKHLTGR